MNFTLDGEYLDDVWAIVLSEIDEQMYFNGYGRSFDFGPGVVGFEFIVWGDATNPYVSASRIIPIINDDSSDLFGISGGQLIIGLGEDIVLSQSSLSINGGIWGDISTIVFDYSSQGDHVLNSVVLIPEPIPGDFDSDGDVDGNDFGLWQAGYPMASGATLATGDADGDGDVDGVDFGIWQANYPTSASAATTIPEPATLALLLMGGLALAKRRRK